MPTPLPVPDRVSPIAIVTDSSAQLPASIAERYAVATAPIAIMIDAVAFREGVDLTIDAFFSAQASGSAISTSQPAPGDFVQIYTDLAAGGAEHILSVHVGAELSGTLNSARHAAELVDIPVTLIDTTTTSFGVGACVWEAARCLERGGTAADAQDRIEQLVPRISTSVLLDGLAHVRAGGRYNLDGPEDSTMVFAGVGSDLDIIGTATTLADLVKLLARPFALANEPIRAAVALAEPATLPYTEGLEAALKAMDHVVETIRYQVGPSIAAHTGPGTAGGFFWPANP